jgi:hypothetical protein
VCHFPHGEGNAHIARTRRQLVNRRIGAIGQLRNFEGRKCVLQSAHLRITNASSVTPFNFSRSPWNEEVLTGSATRRKLPVGMEAAALLSR